MKRTKQLFYGIKRDFITFQKAFRDWELRGLLFFVLIIIAAGVVFYMIVEGWDFVEALYFCVATLTTVGYGDLHPTNDLSRIFTTLYVLVGVGFILGFVNVVARQATKPVVAKMVARDQDKHNDEN
jgi:hypothetical protein